jgi:hypothetical protein
VYRILNKLSDTTERQMLAFYIYGELVNRIHSLLLTCWTDNQAKLDLDVWRVLFFAEPVFLNVYGAQESIPRNEFR